MRKEKLERAIGVIYLPQSERVSHYLFADISDQFDAVVHFDESGAVEPLKKTQLWKKAKCPKHTLPGIKFRWDVLLNFV